MNAQNVTNVNRFDVLNSIKEVQLFPRFDAISLSYVAKYFNVDYCHIVRAYRSHRDNLLKLGARRISVDEIRNAGYTVKTIAGANKVCRLEDGFDFRISARSHIFLNKDCLLYLASILSDSDVACEYQRIAGSAKPEIAENISSNLPAVTYPPCIENNADKDGDIQMEISPAPIKNQSSVQCFTNPDYGNLRTLLIDGEPWFVAVDVCRALEIDNTAIRRLDEDEKMTMRLTQGETNRSSNTNVINEPGLYSLVLGSRKPEAKAFKRWITHEVIPSLRKNGAYVMDQESLTETELIARALIACNRIIQERNERIQSLETERTVLIADVQSWDYRSIINALVKKYAVAVNIPYSAAWNEFYRQVAYKCHINLKMRKPVRNEKSFLSRAKESELPHIAKVAAAMCEAAGLDVAKIINEVNAGRMSGDETVD